MSKEKIPFGSQWEANDMLRHVVGSLRAYPNGGGDKELMAEVERIEQAAYQRGAASQSAEAQDRGHELELAPHNPATARWCFTCVTNGTYKLVTEAYQRGEAAMAEKAGQAIRKWNFMACSDADGLEAEIRSLAGAVPPQDKEPGT
jgi:hypothetical protein